MSTSSANKHDFPLTRSLLLSLLIVYISVVSLHLSQLPWWVLGLCLAVIVWRVNILRERWSAPKLVLQILLTIVIVFALKLEYSQWFFVDPMITLLVVALSFKLLEIRYRRDYLVILFLCYFVIASSFLLNQSVVHSALGTLSVLLTTAALIQLYCLQFNAARIIRLSIVMLFQSIALMLVLMLVLPRLNPLWSIPLQDNSGVTGISDSMSPGDLSQLILSDELALRITFADKTFEQSSMYWRGIVFDDFDGRRWQRAESVEASINRFSNANLVTLKQQNQQGVAYEVLMEPTGQHWLFGVPLANIKGLSTSIIQTPQQEIFKKTKVHQRMKYQVVSYTDNVVVNKRLSDNLRRRLVSLPENFNPKTKAQAQEWRQQVKSDREYIDRVLDFYRQNFTYTLAPPKLGVHTVDEFLFSTLQGFCEHFSSSFTVLMRSVGIPARVIVGYQGGTWSDNNEYLSVRQRDAHAWVEVWLSDQGWIRVDPTAAVSSIRINQGIESALPESELIQLNSSKNSVQWLNHLYSQWQQLDYRWQRWVLDYDANKQQDLLRHYLGDITPTKMALALLIPLLLIVLVLSISSFRHLLVPVSTELRLYRQLQKKLLKLGVDSQQGETVSNYCARAAQQLPYLKSELDRVLYAFEAV